MNIESYIVEAYKESRKQGISKDESFYQACLQAADVILDRVKDFGDDLQAVIKDFQEAKTKIAVKQRCEFEFQADRQGLQF